jgi:aromatic-L-amino-acid decarboxylase
MTQPHLPHDPTFDADLAETGLDPDDWSALRDLGHKMVDDALDMLAGIRERPVWQPLPASAREAFAAPLGAPQDAADVYADFRAHVAPHPTGNIHPRFWGWVQGTGSPLGALTHLLVGTLNANVWGGDQAAIEVERQVVRWLAEALRFGSGTSGILVGGGSGANLVGLTVARNTMAPDDVAVVGVAGLPRQMTLYASVETHGCVAKSAEMLGLGSHALRRIAADRDRRIDLAALARAVARDRADGHQPFCVVGNAGTVGSGAFDNLDALADFAAGEGLWLHVDGAFGGFAALSPRLAHLVRGVERADSLAVSLHKWLHVTYDAGLALIRDEAAHKRSFTRPAAYLQKLAGLSGGDHWFSEYGFELSRPFRALGAWMTLKHYGLEKLGMLVEQNVRQAGHLAALVQASPALELLAPVPLNIVCFRYTAPGLDAAALDAVNLEILRELHESGFAVPSSTLVDGRFALRVAITNHRTRLRDVEELASRVVALGDRLAAERAVPLTAVSPEAP